MAYPNPTREFLMKLHEDSLYMPIATTKAKRAVDPIKLAVPDTPTAPITKPVQLTAVPPQTSEAAGAARFTAVSYPNAPVKSPLPPTLEDRITELEKVVHAIAPYSRNSQHSTVTSWLSRMKAVVKGL